MKLDTSVVTGAISALTGLAAGMVMSAALWPVDHPLWLERGLESVVVPRLRIVEPGKPPETTSDPTRHEHYPGGRCVGPGCNHPVPGHWKRHGE
jgi:hypothetical protein